MLRYLFRIKFCRKIVHQIDPNSALPQVFVSFLYMFVALKIAQTKHRLELLAAAMDFPSPTYTTREAHISNIKIVNKIKVANGTSHFTKPTRISDCCLHRMASVSGIIWCRHPLTCTVSGCNSMSRGVKSWKKGAGNRPIGTGIGRRAVVKVVSNSKKKHRPSIYCHVNSGIHIIHIIHSILRSLW